MKKKIKIKIIIITKASIYYMEPFQRSFCNLAPFLSLSLVSARRRPFSALNLSSRPRVFPTESNVLSDITFYSVVSSECLLWDMPRRFFLADRPCQIILDLSAVSWWACLTSFLFLILEIDSISKSWCIRSTRLSIREAVCWIIRDSWTRVYSCGKNSLYHGYFVQPAIFNRRCAIFEFIVDLIKVAWTKISFWTSVITRLWCVLSFGSNRYSICLGCAKWVPLYLLVSFFLIILYLLISFCALSDSEHLIVIEE